MTSCVIDRRSWTINASSVDPFCPVANDAEARVEVATVLRHALTSRVELIDAIDAMEVGVDQATADEKPIHDASAERRECITIVLVATLLRRGGSGVGAEPKTPGGARDTVDRGGSPSDVARIQLLHRDDGAAEQIAIRHRARRREASVRRRRVRDRVEGGRTEELHRALTGAAPPLPD